MPIEPIRKPLELAAAHPLDHERHWRQVRPQPLQ
jgi:hypothetical protein